MVQYVGNPQNALPRCFRPFPRLKRPTHSLPTSFYDSDAAKAYLNTQYKWLALWVALLFVVISVTLVQDNKPLAGVYTAISYAVGSALSGMAGYAGMYVATSANCRTAEACRTSISRGLQVSFASGAVMGNAVVALALGGLWVMYLIWSSVHSASINPLGSSPSTPYITNPDFNLVWGYLAGFGASPPPMATLFASSPLTTLHLTRLGP